MPLLLVAGPKVEQAPVPRRRGRRRPARRGRFPALLVAFGLGGALTGGAGRAAAQDIVGPAPAPVPPLAPPTGTIRLLVALTWEGRDLLPYNLEALRSFRGRFTDISVLHLLSPAYFTRAGADADATRARIRSVMRPHDQVAMQVAGWKSLAASAGVIFRGAPTFWGAPLGKSCASDCGLEVPINIYPEEDASRLLDAGLKALAANGFGRPRGLAAEGWVASPQLLEAAVRQGMVYDFSAVAAELIAKRARLFPLYDWVKMLWPTVTPHSQPFTISTPTGTLTEFPQSLAAVDYLSASELTALFKESIDLAKRPGAGDVFVPLVFYQETAGTTLPLVAEALQTMFNLAGQAGVAVVPAELPGLELPPAPAEPTPPPEHPDHSFPMVH